MRRWILVFSILTILVVIFLIVASNPNEANFPDKKEENKKIDSNSSVNITNATKWSSESIAELREKEKQECEDSEGSWERAPGSCLEVQEDSYPCYFCNNATSDAGKECTDSSQCESYCQAPEDTTMDENTTGTCYNSLTADCMKEVKNGITQGTWCKG